MMRKEQERLVSSLESKLQSERERGDFFESLAGELSDIATRLKVHIQMMKTAHNIPSTPITDRVMQDYSNAKQKRYKPSRRMA